MKPRRQGDPEGEGDHLERRPDRAQLRAALALEAAGELQEAARMFEHVGEHAQASSLRLEHAETLRDEQQRLAVLREGCARNPASTAQGQALHQALGEALLRVAEGVEPGARRRALALEAAQALEEGKRSDQAGRLYEQLGLLARATKAYTDAGDIERLERVHAVLEQREHRQRAQRNLEREVEAALETGHRRLARTLIVDHLRESKRLGIAPASSLTQSLHDIERRMLGRDAAVVRVHAPGSDQPIVLRYLALPRLRLGRGPQCEIPVDGAALSREHVALALGADEPLGAAPGQAEPRLILRDLGSRAGSFLDGDALDPGDAWVLYDDEDPSERELGLGIATSFELWSRRGPEQRPMALLRDGRLRGQPATTPVTAWTCYAPLGGPLWVEPHTWAPLALSFEAEFLVARPEPGVQVELAGLPVGPGEAIELLAHERATFMANGAVWQLEVEVL